MPSLFCISGAATPGVWVASKYAAQNYMGSWVLVRCTTVPAVTNVSWWQQQHFSTGGRVANPKGSPTVLHFSQAKPPGQRSCSRYCRQAASFGTIRWTASGFVRGLMRGWGRRAVSTRTDF
jgi:hypothetical protein